MSNRVFALDIGTRNVVGLVIESSPKGYKVIAAEIEEHRNRAMLDGQIHDIPQVAEVVSRIKQRLEQRLQTGLDKVAVAAAGRSLKTMRGRALRDLVGQGVTDGDGVLSLEVEAVMEAQRLLAGEGNPSGSYHCVGYSVVNYFLDGVAMTNLIGQTGSTGEAEVIATFLPRVVVDSLYEVVSRAGLEVTSLTLEPIAAINVVIPQGMRQLNLALVDIGAGTSDIAVTEGGTVVGYAMVPAAGDEITECLCQVCLLDFTTGEQVKRQLNQDEWVKYVDALGTQHRAETGQLIKELELVVRDLAWQIAEKVIEINGRSPQAVICIGGGSLTPGLTEQLAQHLNITANRVAIRSRESLTLAVGGGKKLSGPQAVTPLGIAITALSSGGMAFNHVLVNNRPVRFFSSQVFTVADALVAAGLDTRQLFGKPGRGKSLEVNGKIVLLRGGPGTPAIITVNGRQANLDTCLQSGDRLEVQPPQDGQPAGGTIADILPPLSEKLITFNGTPVKMETRVLLNEQPVELSHALEDNARIKVYRCETIEDMLITLGKEREGSDFRIFSCTVNGINKTIRYPRYRLTVNNQPTTMEHPVVTGDLIEMSETPEPAPRVADFLKELGWKSRPLRINVNNSPLELPDTMPQIRINGSEAGIDTPVKDGDELSIAPGESYLIFSDIFRYIDFNASVSQGSGQLILMINGENAQFTTPLHDEDDLVIRWE
ncbi:MAG: cell division FtsA domain-containing protein [Bacillota bacterium]